MDRIVQLTYDPKVLSVPRGCQILSTENRDFYTVNLGSLLGIVENLAVREGQDPSLAKSTLEAVAVQGKITFTKTGTQLWNGVEYTRYSYNGSNTAAQGAKEAGLQLFRAGQYAEAVPLLTSAAEVFPKDESLWQKLFLAAHHSGQHERAVEVAKQAIRQHARSGWLWRELGDELTRIGRLDEAEKALDNARNLDPNSDRLWRYLAALRREQGSLANEIDALESLYALGKANPTDLNNLGIAYRNHKNFAKALECYRLSVALESDVAPLFNMGLVFNDPEVSQDADAADAYRRALVLRPTHQRAKEQLDITKRKLAPLADQARSAAAVLIQTDEWFQFYVSPFEVLQIGRIESLEEIDVKAIQRGKKRLLQEIDLNDGKVSWLDHYPLDKSRALAVEDELHDEAKRRYHWAVFQNKRLLRFLTHGDIEHFLYSDDYFPQETIELLDEEPDFRTFLSKPFARQYNLTLTRAIERRLLPVVEVLFDGRRWVVPEDDDVCFEGAFKRIGDMVELIRTKAVDGSSRKPSLAEIEKFLRQHSFPELFNLLPTAFASAQREVIGEIRSLAISCHNEHDDSDLSKGILSLSKQFTLRSVELTKCLEEDFKTVERFIAEERKHQVHTWCTLKSGLTRSWLEITKEGIGDGAKFFPANTVKDLRWGITVIGYSSGERHYVYVFSVSNDSNDCITESWSSDPPGEHAQTEVFSQLVNASQHYLGGVVTDKIKNRLLRGQQVVVGPCTLTRHGITFRSQGLIFKKERLIPWGDVVTDTRNGDIIVLSKTQRALSIAVPMADAANAVILPRICAAMRER